MYYVSNYQVSHVFSCSHSDLSWVNDPQTSCIGHMPIRHSHKVPCFLEKANSKVRVFKCLFN